MEEPTIHVQSAISIKTLAKAINTLNMRKFPHNHSWGYLIRVCVEAVANKSEIEPETSVALDFIRKEGFSVEQLKYRVKTREAIVLGEQDILVGQPVDVVGDSTLGTFQSSNSADENYESKDLSQIREALDKAANGGFDKPEEKEKE